MRILVDLQTDLDTMAKKIAGDEPDPEKWDTPLLYLMEALMIEARGQKSGLKKYELMVTKVRDALDDQLEDKNWEN